MATVCMILSTATFQYWPLNQIDTDIKTHFSVVKPSPNAFHKQKCFYIAKSMHRKYGFDPYYLTFHSHKTSMLYFFTNNFKGIVVVIWYDHTFMWMILWLKSECLAMCLFSMEQLLYLTFQFHMK